MRFLLMIAAIFGLLAVGPQPAFAQFYGPGPWCAVVNMGTGDMHWDCQYWSLQQCVPNVLAGNRGFCNPNPSFVPRYRRDRTKAELKSIVRAIAEELKRNSRVAKEEQRQHEAPIIKMARELGLDPRPAGHNDSAWMASCPQSRNHWIMISPSHNEFGCGYCRRKGGPEELRAFYNHVRREGVSHDGA